MQNRPTFDLVRVAAAARAGHVQLGKTRARDILLPYLGELVVCTEFARAVLLALKPDNFNVTKDLDEGPHDEYGIHLSDDLREQFGLDVEFWYVKLTVREGLWGEEIFCLSLHPLEHAMNCVGGCLDPTPRDEP